MYFKVMLGILAFSVTTAITINAQFTSGGGLIYTTNTTDKIGKGTIPPSAKLVVRGSGRFTDAVTATSGTGLELDYIIPSDYARNDRTNAVYKPLRINDSSLFRNDAFLGNVSVGLFLLKVH